ncbi:uncharacterized protein B0H64DRAFT_435636 [Chaetomium fimeti]|uniref:Deoxyribonuclease NucA/NucB domain-containing protein n=1 Tax=Chaetomium fimeti TaxID=1854472 RepID=A0AAE0H8G0_9PEZI|nr:hypothetical protein B0H64DRAFT_435636 [Chaetomium fimeti]
MGMDPPPRRLAESRLSSTSAQLEPNDLSMPMVTENERGLLGASTDAGSLIVDRQGQRCENPGWVIVCPDRMRLATFYDFWRRHPNEYEDEYEDECYIVSSEPEEPEPCTDDVDSDATLPTMTMPYKEKYTTPPGSDRQLCLDNRELMNSMCKGITEARKCISTRMKLTYRPDLFSTNRPKMCPDGFCDEANVPCPPGDSSGPCNPYAHFVDIPSGRAGVKWTQTCDEFPFARSLQGGEGTAICIPGWQNSFQGFNLMRLRRDVGERNDYVVELTGWDCETGRPTEGSAQNCGLDAASAVKRDDDLGGESLTQDDFFSDMTPAGENALMMFLGDVNPGSYTFHLTLRTGTLTSLHAISGDGTEIETSVTGGSTEGTSLQASPANPYTITLRVTELAYDVSLWALTMEERVEVGYNLTYAAAGTSGAGPGRVQFVGGGLGGGIPSRAPLLELGLSL